MAYSEEISDHYRQMLELSEPWEIWDVALSFEETRLDIVIMWPGGVPAPCPECGEECSIKDLREERVWRHLNAMQFQTFLHCQVPRSQCPEHGIQTIRTPWAEPNSRWTLRFEREALNIMLLAPNIAKASKALGISWDQANNLRARAVARGLQRRTIKEIEHIGMDEKSFRSRGSYITVLTDLDEGRVLEVAEKKNEEAARTVLEAIPADQRIHVGAVAMDMSATFEKVAKEYFPEADIVYDKYHIVSTLNKAVDKVRRDEHSALMKQGISIFAKTRYLWLTKRKNWSEFQETQYQEIEQQFSRGKLSQTRIGRAWSIKEFFYPFWDYIYRTPAQKFFNRWYYWATHSRLKPVIEAAKTLKNHLDGILNYFSHGITSAFVEGTNLRIQEIKASARGFRNFPNYRIAILFDLGKLDVYP